MRRRTFIALLATLPLPLPAFARTRSDGLIEPALRIVPGGASMPRVALTFDACMGHVDLRILDALVENQIAATIFVTRRWLDRNADALKTLQAHPELFELQNHGAMHVPAVTGAQKLYGLETAGTLAAVQAEVDGGAAAMLAHGIPAAKWYRDATALYSPDALEHIRQMGFRIAGFSLNADFGASLPAADVAARLATAKDGDVIIGHINQPKRASGEGIVTGIIALKQRGFRFVKLGEATELDAWGEPA